MPMAGIALAEFPSSTAYHFSSHPMISGTVVSVNDHQMVVDTDQGERVTLELDTRTMAPRDLAPGMVMRAEFRALEDCRLRAERIMPIRGDMSTERTQAYANTRDSREVIARSTSTRDDGYRDVTAYRAGAEGRESVPLTAGEPSPGAMMTATPNTAAYRFSDRPLISGGVVAVNDHRLVVRTDQGQVLGMVMDSRTMVPREVEPGSVVRVEFTRMEDGRYYAKRVSQISGVTAEREQQYAHTRDSDLVLAQNALDCGFTSAGTGNTAAAVDERPTVVAAADPVISESSPADDAERPDTLPQTASHQPLVLLLGLFALGSAGLIALARGPGRA
jgi:uncharacterized OB-fold protein